MSRRVIELHDSSIDSIDETEAGELSLRGTFYIDGSFTDAEILIKDGQCERDREELDFPILLEGGSLAVDGEARELLPCPFEADGETALLLVPVDSGEFTVRGAGVEIKLVESES